MEVGCNHQIGPLAYGQVHNVKNEHDGKQNLKLVFVGIVDVLFSGSMEDRKRLFFNHGSLWSRFFLLLFDFELFSLLLYLLNLFLSHLK